MFEDLATVILVSIFSEWLAVQNVVAVDTAVCSSKLRKLFLMTLNTTGCILSFDFKQHYSDSYSKTFIWFAKRRAKMKHLIVWTVNDFKHRYFKEIVLSFCQSIFLNAQTETFLGTIDKKIPWNICVLSVSFDSWNKCSEMMNCMRMVCKQLQQLNISCREQNSLFLDGNAIQEYQFIFDFVRCMQLFFFRIHDGNESIQLKRKEEKVLEISTSRWNWPSVLLTVNDAMKPMVASNIAICVTFRASITQLQFAFANMDDLMEWLAKTGICAVQHELCAHCNAGNAVMPAAIEGVLYDPAHLQRVMVHFPGSSVFNIVDTHSLQLADMRHRVDMADWSRFLDVLRTYPIRALSVSNCNAPCLWYNSLLQRFQHRLHTVSISLYSREAPSQSVIACCSSLTSLTLSYRMPDADLEKLLEQAQWKRSITLLHLDQNTLTEEAAGLLEPFGRLRSIQFRSLEPMDSEEYRDLVLPLIRACAHFAFTHCMAFDGTALSITVLENYAKRYVPFVDLLAVPTTLLLQDAHAEYNAYARLMIERVTQKTNITELFAYQRGTLFAEADLKAYLAALPHLQRFHFPYLVTFHCPHRSMTVYDMSCFRITELQPFLHDVSHLTVFSSSRDLLMDEEQQAGQALPAYNNLTALSIHCCTITNEQVAQLIPHIERLQHCTVDGNCANLDPNVLLMKCRDLVTLSIADTEIQEVRLEVLHWCIAQNPLLRSLEVESSSIVSNDFNCYLRVRYLHVNIIHKKQ